MTPESPPPAVKDLCRRATHCRHCFGCFDVEASRVDLAQPRWIGPEYFQTTRRIVVLMINPGGGDHRLDCGDLIFRDKIQRFAAGTGSLEEVFLHQARDMPNWGSGRFCRFFFDWLQLNLDQIGFANIAWCGTRSNRYPISMLRHCWTQFTEPLLKTLAPHVVILSGKAVQQFRNQITEVSPASQIIETWHFANRKSTVENERECQRVRGILAQFHS